MPERKENSLRSLLEKIRWALVWSGGALLVASLLALWFSTDLFTWLRLPLAENFKGEEGLIGTGLLEAFVVRFKIAFVSALFASSPFFFYQLWRVAGPLVGMGTVGFAVAFVVSSTVFFLAGAVFCRSVVLPVAFSYLIDQFRGLGATAEIRAAEYFGFLSRMMIGFGVTFELPVVSFFLARTGLVSHRELWKYSRVAFLIIFVVAAVLTPGPDVLSQLLLAAPLCLLYGISIGVAYLAHPGVSRA